MQLPRPPPFIVLACIMLHFGTLLHFQRMVRESGMRHQGIPDHEGFIWDLCLLCPKAEELHEEDEEAEVIRLQPQPWAKEMAMRVWAFEHAARLRSSVVCRICGQRRPGCRCLD